MSDITIIKLIDGSTLVGIVSAGPDSYEIEHPIEVVSHLSMNRGIVGEQLSLRPWIAFSDTGIFKIDRINVLAVSNLDEKFVEGYNSIVSATYLNENVSIEDLPKLSDMSESYLEEALDDLDLETLAELADAVIKKQIH